MLAIAIALPVLASLAAAQVNSADLAGLEANFKGEYAARATLRAEPDAWAWLDLVTPTRCWPATATHPLARR